MSKWGKLDYSSLLKLQQKIDNYIENNTLLEDVARELSARLLALVIPRTPVGQYPKGSGRVGGTLRRGWTVDTQKEAEARVNNSVKNYVESLELSVKNGYVEVEIINPVEYAIYVEKGHRTNGGRGYVKGRHMLRISIEDLKKDTPKIIHKKVMDELRGVFK